MYRWRAMHFLRHSRFWTHIDTNTVSTGTRQTRWLITAEMKITGTGKPACHTVKMCMPLLQHQHSRRYYYRYQTSSTSLWWCHLVNACEVTAHLIGLLAKPWRRLFLAAFTLWAKTRCCCCLARQCVCRVIAALRGRLLYVVYCM